MKKYIFTLLAISFLFCLAGQTVALAQEGEVTLDEVQNEITKPMPKITLPGLKWTEPSAVEDATGKIYYLLPFFGNYLAAAYRWAVVAGAIIAVVMIMNNGFKWIMSAGEPEKIKEAQTRIVEVLVGTMLLSISYILLYTINPELVNFRNLRVLYISKAAYAPLYLEGPLTNFENEYESMQFSGGTSGIPSPAKKSTGCLLITFAPGKNIGDRVDEKDKVRIEFLGTGPKFKIWVNKAAQTVFETVSKQILNSTDEEVVGYLKWMNDVAQKKAHDLQGEKDGNGVLSVDMRKIRGTYDTHALGIAVDIMDRSNWDIHLPAYTGKNGKPAQQYCEMYKENLEKMKDGSFEDFLKDDPYKMYDRINKKIESCLNNFDNGKDPFTTIPEGMIKIFEDNGFYWAGRGWARPGQPIVRSDSMHFEYLGPCKK